jgi:hypothetical protein
VGGCAFHDDPNFGERLPRRPGDSESFRESPTSSRSFTAEITEITKPFRFSEIILSFDQMLVKKTSIFWPVAKANHL